MAQLAECLSNMHRALGFDLHHHINYVTWHTCHLSHLERNLEGGSRPGLASIAGSKPASDTGNPVRKHSVSGLSTVMHCLTMEVSSEGVILQWSSHHVNSAERSSKIRWLDTAFSRTQPECVVNRRCVRLLCGTCFTVYQFLIHRRLCSKVAQYSETYKPTTQAFIPLSGILCCIEQYAQYFLMASTLVGLFTWGYCLPWL